VALSKHQRLLPVARGAGAPWSSCKSSGLQGDYRRDPACAGFPARATGADTASSVRRYGLAASCWWKSVR